jgi:uncharacterized protein
MTEDIAISSLDFYYEYAEKDLVPVVSFYGGEPLLEKRLIKKIVNYAKQKDPRTAFTIQTNGYLLDRETFDFLYKNSFLIHISIDGPQEIHDKCRVLPSGKGTFNKIISNLKYLFKNDQEYYMKNVYIRYTEGTLIHLNDIIDFHHSHPLLKDLQASMSFINSVGLNENISYSEMTKSPNGSYQQEKEITNKAFWQYVKDMSKNVRFYDMLFSMGLVKVINRKSLDGDTFVPEGYCRLGRTKLFVSADGDYKACDRTTRIPFIGNIEKGMDWDIIKELERDAMENSKECYRCWALPMCNVCWIHLHSKDSKIDTGMKKAHCQNIKKSLYRWLIRYLQIFEYDPELLDKIETS